MIEPTAADHDQEDNPPDPVFRRAMAAVTEQADAQGREDDVLAALFPLFLDNVGDDEGEDLGL
jgi:hypothetical protein